MKSWDTFSVLLVAIAAFFAMAKMSMGQEQEGP